MKDLCQVILNECNNFCFLFGKSSNSVSTDPLFNEHMIFGEIYVERGLIVDIPYNRKKSVSHIPVLKVIYIF